MSLTKHLLISAFALSIPAAGLAQTTPASSPRSRASQPGLLHSNLGMDNEMTAPPTTMTQPTGSTMTHTHHPRRHHRASAHQTARTSD